MRLSFMVDRMYDVGAAVRGLTNLVDPSISYLAANTTIKSHSVKTEQLTSMSIDDATGSALGEVLLSESVAMDRIPFSPSVAQLLPTFKPRGLVDNAEKVADLLALIYNFLPVKIKRIRA
jgi:hypothetical protein